LVDALLKRGDRVRVLDSLVPQAHPDGEPKFLSHEAELVRGDLRDREAVDRALHDIDVVYHQGGMVGNGQSMFEVRRYIDVNAVGTATLLESMVARRGQFRRLVVASSMVVYGDGAYACDEHGTVTRALRPEARLRARLWEPVCPRCGAEVKAIATTEDQPLRPTSTYGISKRDQEELSLTIGRTYRIPTVALRYLCTYGSRQALSNPYTGVAAIWANRLLHGKPPVVFEDGHQRRDFVHVSDVVSANLAAAAAADAADYQAFNVATGESFTIRELASGLGEALGRSIPPDITGAYRDGDIRHCFADVSQAKTFLGWKSNVTLNQGIAELATWASTQRPEDSTDRANKELRERGVIRLFSSGSSETD
jgi:dTDP-L-rhamnose 4-epimerase